MSNVELLRSLRSVVLKQLSAIPDFGLIEALASRIMSEELKTRTKQFAHGCVKLATVLPKTPLGNHIRGQLIRCSTSVASNYRAACHAQSKASFISKVSIVIEEADESYFWLEFVIDENMIKGDLIDPLL